MHMTAAVLGGGTEGRHGDWGVDFRLIRVIEVHRLNGRRWLGGAYLPLGLLACGRLGGWRARRGLLPGRAQIDLIDWNGGKLRRWAPGQVLRRACRYSQGAVESRG